MVKFSKIEVRDLFKAWLIISLAFGIVLSGGVFGWALLETIILSAITVGIAFLLHEMGHKYFAQKYGCFAEFRADNYMLFLAMITSFFGIVFAAPGAVIILGRVTKAKYGKIALAGPMMHIFLMLIASFFNDLGLFDTFIFVNAMLALFYMIPIHNLDGAKILLGSPVLYLTSLVFMVSFVILAYFLSPIPLVIITGLASLTVGALFYYHVYFKG